MSQCTKYMMVTLKRSTGGPYGGMYVNQLFENLLEESSQSNIHLIGCR